MHVLTTILGYPLATCQSYIVTDTTKMSEQDNNYILPTVGDCCTSVPSRYRSPPTDVRLTSIMNNSESASVTIKWDPQGVHSTTPSQLPLT